MKLIKNEDDSIELKGLIFRKVSNIQVLEQL